MVMPGLVSAELGADDVDDALVWRLDVEELDAEVGAVFAQGVRSASQAIWSTMWRRSSMLLVGTLWSTVAMVRSGRRSLRPAMRRPSKACGLVTSWTR